MDNSKIVSDLSNALQCLTLSEYHIEAGNKSTALSLVDAAQPNIETSIETLSNPRDLLEGELVEFPYPEARVIVGDQLKLGSSLNPYPWYDEVALTKGIEHAAYALDPETDIYYPMYYDLGLTLYTLFYRTGDTSIRDKARQVVDRWVAHLSREVDYHHNEWHEMAAPRSQAFSGVMLRALDGRPELWPELVDAVRHHMDTWVLLRLDYANLHYGVRDGAYALLYAALLAQVHPDQAIRDEMKQKALDGAVLYYARLQREDGGWYWTADGLNAPDGEFSQPFQVGLLMEALRSVHELTGDPVVADSFVKGTEWLYRYGYDAQEPYKAMWYFVFPDHSGTGHGPNSVMWNERQLNATCIHAFGYAYRITGDEAFKAAGDDILEATFNRDPKNDKGSRGLSDYRAKEYNQAKRTSGRFLVDRLAGIRWVA